MPNKNFKLALICTVGGHFEQLTNLDEFYNQYDHFWITNKNTQTESTLKNEKKYFIEAAHFKKPWTYLKHIPEVIKIFKKEKPSHIISTGSGRTALIPFFLSKLFDIQFIYIETYSRVNNLTMMAKLLSKMQQPILSQWENHHKGVIYIGPVFKNIKAENTNTFSQDHVFVAIGTRNEPYNRLLEAVEKLIEKKIIPKPVIVQAGYTAYQSNNLELFDFCAAEKINEYIKNSKFVITQESAGIVNKCLKYHKKFIVMPRDYSFGELPARGDMKEDLQYKLEEMGYTKVVHTTDELENAILNLEQLKTGFKFDNSFAISKLTELVEKNHDGSVR